MNAQSVDEGSVRVSINQAELARRLKEARIAADFTQDWIADRVGVSRSAIVQIEAGKRAVSSIELTRLAHQYGRDLGSFFAEEFNTENSLVAHFRAENGFDANEELIGSLQECLRVGRELADLETLTGADRVASTVAYRLQTPRTRWEALTQGRQTADAERQRLRLGDTPVEDIVSLLGGQGVRAAVLDLPDDVSGLTLVDHDAGPLVVANRANFSLRRAFSFAHEYGHVLMDRNDRGTISRQGDDQNLLEVRANSFAAAFLMPEDGIRRMIADLGRSTSARLARDTGDGEVRPPSNSAIRFTDVAELAHHYRVTRKAMAFRLRALGMLTPAQLEAILGVNETSGASIARGLGLDPPNQHHERESFNRRFAKLATSAYEAQMISRSKLMEHLTGVCDMTREDATDLADRLEDAVIE